MTRVVAAWLALMAGLVLGRELDDAASAAVAAIAGGAAVWLGFAAAARCRTLSPGADSAQARRLLQSVAAGVALGLANLAANWIIASHHPTLRALLVQRLTTLDPIEGLIASPLIEEVLVRLCLMSVLAWIVWRLTNRSAAAFTCALIASSIVFAALHLARPFPGQPGLVAFYRASLLLKYTLAGLPMGWLFWRWGLPYAIACHVVANGTHLLLQRIVF